MGKHTKDELDKLFKDGETADKAHFAEQRTNILLYSGQHFKKKAQAFIERNKSKLSEDTKLKLSENHIQVVCNRIITAIHNQAPDCLFTPNNKSELADVKDAELCNSVKEYGSTQIRYTDKVEKLLNNFVVTGEAFKFYYFDPHAGKLIGYKQATTKEGSPLFTDADGNETLEQVDQFGRPNQPAQSKEPVFEGQLKLEIPEPYNVVRHKGAKSIDESPFLTIKKYVTEEEAKTLVKSHPKREDLEKIITSAGSDTWRTFDSNAGDYNDQSGQVLIKYWFFRKCYDYPNGYFYVQIADEIISEGELPFGMWPIEYAGYRAVSSATRCISLIRDLRPAQTHLNYLVSTSAFHIVALGDDKIITQMGSKLQQGPTWNGVRSFSVSGPGPVVLQGRDAGQFERSIDRQVATIYRLADMDYQLEESKVQDTWGMLFASLRMKLKHANSVRKFESFIANGWTTYIHLSQKYLDDDAIIKRVGAREAINVIEFKNMSTDGFSVKAKPVSGTLEDQIGSALEAQQILQYVGKDLPKSVLARIINKMPFFSKESVVGDMLLTDQNIDNDILALDRGEFVPAMKDDNHEEYIPRIKSRMKQADFRLKSPQVQQNYQMRYQQHVEFQAQIAAELQQAESGFIPADGGLIKVSVYDDTTNQNMVLPYSSIVWLKDKLAQQGVGQEVLSKLDKQTQNDILSKAQQLSAMNNQNGMGQAAGMQQPTPMPYPA